MAFSVEQLTRYFEYLDQLRDSGVTNMFGAGKYLQEDFGLDQNRSSIILGLWMASYNSNLSAKERAENNV